MLENQQIVHVYGSLGLEEVNTYAGQRPHHSLILMSNVITPSSEVDNIFQDPPSLIMEINPLLGQIHRIEPTDKIPNYAIVVRIWWRRREVIKLG